jgi:Flp pilus assembly protein TadG
MMRPLTSFLRSDRASVTVEFVAIFPFFLFVAFFVMEVTLAFFWWKTAEKAAHIGARVAIVSNIAAGGVPNRNGIATDAISGTLCSDASNPCVSFGPVTCDSTSCDAATFDRVVGRMQNIFGVIQDQNVTITYENTGLGFAGGPTVPLVTVNLSGIQFQTGIVSILGNFIGGDENALTTLPDISATLTGEDLSQNGA